MDDALLMGTKASEPLKPELQVRVRGSKVLEPEVRCSGSSLQHLFNLIIQH